MMSTAREAFYDIEGNTDNIEDDPEVKDQGAEQLDRQAIEDAD